MITNLQKAHNRSKLQADFRLGIWPYDYVIPKADVDAGRLSYMSLIKTIGAVIPACRIFEDATFEADKVLVNGKDVRNRKGEAFYPLLISEAGERFLSDYTNETVYESFGVAVWMFPHLSQDPRVSYTEIEL